MEVSTQLIGYFLPTLMILVNYLIHTVKPSRIIARPQNNEDKLPRKTLTV